MLNASTMIIFLFILAVLIVGIFAFVHQPKFGKIRDNGPEQLSPNWSKGQFQNQHFTPNLTEGVSFLQVLAIVLFKKNPKTKPPAAIPSVKNDLRSLDRTKNQLVWFGHSSYLLIIDGKTILVDPVFSGYASPIKATTRSFPGSDAYTAADMPAIDYLFLSHDHWDHLDYDTILKLESKVNKVITGLGTGAHLELWGYDMNKVLEKDWNDFVDMGDGFTAHMTPARHFSGRGLQRNKSLWTSMVLKTPAHTIYLGGDSGYDTHFKAIGDQYGPFDLAILECGQYDQNWKYIHMMPEEVAVAAEELKAKKLLPVHWAKFALANHDWNDPIIRLTKANKQIPLLTPLIGEVVLLDEPQAFSEWWKNV